MDIQEIEIASPEDYKIFLEREDWYKCQRCELYKTRRNIPAMGGGNTKNPLLFFVGQAPGKTEEIQGKPLVGSSGELLNDIFTILGLEREQMYFTNTVLCRPPTYEDPTKDRAPNNIELKACRPRLLEEIYSIDPTMIVALGGVATTALGGAQCSLTKRRGDIVEIKIPGRSGTHATCTYPAMITWHPSGVLRKIHVKEGFPVLRTVEDVLYPKTDFAELAGDILIAAAISEEINNRHGGAPVSDLFRSIAARL